MSVLTRPALCWTLGHTPVRCGPSFPSHCSVAGRERCQHTGRGVEGAWHCRWKPWWVFGLLSWVQKDTWRLPRVGVSGETPGRVIESGGAKKREGRDTWDLAWWVGGGGGEEQGTTGEAKSFWMEQGSEVGLWRYLLHLRRSYSVLWPVSEGRANRQLLEAAVFTVDPSGHWSSEYWSLCFHL